MAITREEVAHLAFEVRQSVGGLRTIEVVNLPVFDAVAPRRKFGFETMPMLRFFHSDDVVSRGEIGFRHWSRKTFEGVALDAELFEVGQRVPRDRAIIAAIKGEAAGIGDPVDIVRRGKPIEINLCEAATVIISRAEKEDLLLHLLFRDDARAVDTLAAPGVFHLL